MTATIQRRLLTNAVIARLQTLQVNAADCPVGDMAAPAAGGWPEPGPNAPGASFVPYVVVFPMQAAGAASTGSVGTPQGDWHMPYQVQSFGVTRDQCEWMADLARDALQAFKHQILALGDANYKVQQCWTETIGGVTRVPSTDPPFFGQSDLNTLWLAKQRS